MLIIGLNPVLETLDFAPERIEKILILEGITNSKVSRIQEIAKKKNIQTERRSKQEFEKIIDKKDKSEGISQGVIAVAAEFEYYDLDKLVEELREKKDVLLVVLDEIQDPHNLGAIIRTAAAVGADGVLISEKNSAKVTHTVIKASAGATNYIKICLKNNIYNAIKSLQISNFFVIGASLKAKQSHFDLELKGRFAVVFGSEGKGLRTNIANLCDELVKIPVANRIESLNVSVSAGVLLYEILRQRNS